MEIRLDFNTLSKAVTTQLGFVGTKTESFTFKPSEDGLEISTGDDRRKVCMTVEGEAEGFDRKNKGLSISQDALAGFAKVRNKPKDLKIKAEKGVAEFSAKTKAERILGYANVMPLADYDVEIPDGDDAYVELSTAKGVSARLADAVAYVDIDPTLDHEQMDLWFRFDKAGLFLVAQDRWHMVLFEDLRHKSKKRVEAAMDKALFKRLQDMMGTGACSFHVSDRDVIAEGGNVRARAASLQAKNETNVIDEAKRIRESALAQENTDELEIQRATLDSLLGNLEVSDDPSSAVFSVSKDGKLVVSSPVRKGKAGYMSTQSSVDVDWKQGTKHAANTGMLKDMLSRKGPNDLSLVFGEDEMWQRLVDGERKSEVFGLMMLQET